MLMMLVIVVAIATKSIPRTLHATSLFAMLVSFPLVFVLIFSIAVVTLPLTNITDQCERVHLHLNFI